MATEGIAKNIFNIIDACYYLGRDATREPEPDAKDGEYALVYGPDKEIMDTGWSEENAWIGPHTSTVRWFTNSIASQPLVVEYHSRDTEGNEYSLKRTIPFMTDISDEFGNSAGTSFFFENYQYRIILKSNIDVAENEFVAVDTMRIIPTSVFSVEGKVYGTPDGLPAMPKIRAGEVVCYTSGTAHTAIGTVTLEFPLPEFFFVTVSVRDDSIFVPRIQSKSADKFTVAVWRTDDANWSGGVLVEYIFLGYYVPPKLE